MIEYISDNRYWLLLVVAIILAGIALREFCSTLDKCGEKKDYYNKY